VRRSYVEVQLRVLLRKASDGNCSQALAGIDELGEMRESLHFTYSKFAGFMKESHFQYWVGVLENMCGSEKAAKKRWSKVSKSAVPPDSPDFVFAYLAAKRLGDPDATQRISAALDQVKITSPDATPPALLFARGALLMAQGKGDEGADFLQKATRSKDPLIQYLSLATLAEASVK